MRIRIVAASVLALVCAVSLYARDLPAVDEFAAGRPQPDAAAAVANRAKGLARAGMHIPVEARLRVPTFVWALPDAQQQNGPKTQRIDKQHGKPEESAARAYLDRYASLYQLDTADVTGASVRMIHNTGRGPIIVKLRQQIQGIEIFREEMNMVFDRNLALVGISGYISSASTPGVRGGLTFELDDRSAAAAALKDLTAVGLKNTDLVRGTARGGYDSFTIPASVGLRLEEPIRSKKVYFHLQEGLAPGYYVEIITRDPASYAIDAYAYVISASDGHILFRNNLTADATPAANSGTPYTYRVWATPAGHPQDSPAGNGAMPKVNPVPDGYQAPLIPQTDITLANFPFSMNDPWLPPGATETNGNNVDAYSDLFYPDGYGPIAAPSTPASGDFRAQATGANAFQHTYNAADPYNHVQRQAATTQLFVDVNFLHDWFYDSGFDEASGNAQTDNYGRGGIDNDNLRAEAQDTSGRNNANMATPADGGHPRMQMYMFDGFASGPFFSVTAPAAAAGRRSVGTSSSGPQAFDITADVVLPAPLSACTALTNAASVAGKIVLVDREPTSGADACSIATKFANIQIAGAAGAVLVNLSTWPDTILMLSDPLPGLTMPVLSISYNGALTIKTQLDAANTVTGHMVRDTAFDRDGTIDNAIVAHEWGHYLSNRLIGNGSGLTATQARGMGEGWSDFLGMLTNVRADDTSVPSNATWNGVYPSATYAFSGGADGGTNNGYYFGVRRYPYSTDFTKNGLTFKHIQHGVSLPAGVPVQNNGYSNAEVHNTGEVWTTMLWECYAALLRDTQGGSPRLTFQQAQDRMKQYLVAGLKLTPVNPTFVEARDAILSAAAASDVQDYVRLYQAFAVRGLGADAVAPDRYNIYNLPVVESFTAAGDADVTSSTLVDEGGSCDYDGVLDHGESGRLYISIKNTGTTTLTSMGGTVTVLTSGVTLPSGGAVTFATIAPFESTTVWVPVAMSAGVTGIKAIDFKIEYSDASFTDSPKTTTLSFRGNWDVLPQSTATDTVDASSTTWTGSSGTPPGPVMAWERIQTGVRTLWHVTNAGSISDERLESPPVTVNADGSLKIEFDHLFSFEYGYDGGVIEMSRNGGAWTDIGGSNYNGYIYYYGGGNPLEGRNAFTSTISSPAHVTLKPTVAAGDVVKVRFRIGTDYIIGAPGWDIDNITFSGIVETPFDGVDADSGCTKATTTRLQSSKNPIKLGTNLTLTATVIGPGTPTGTITFYDGNDLLGTVPMVNRSASYSTSSFTAGNHPLTAHYSGAATFLPSSSPVLSQIIDDCVNGPTINGVFGATAIPAGNSATLSVSATGAISYTWFTGIAPDTSTIVGTGTSINVTPLVTTKYWVRVTNGCGSVDSTSVEVTIIPPTKLYLVTPCRLYDSRWYYPGTLAPGETRTLWVAYQCGVYVYPRALAVNVTAVTPSDTGYLTVFAGDSTRPPTSTINFRKNRSRANNTIVPISPGGYLSIYNGGSAPVAYILDVTGYFN